MDARAQVTAISLFSGAGGLCRGLHLAIPGLKVMDYVEISPYARRTLKGAMGKGALTKGDLYSDICDYKPAKGRADLVYGGFPCQDISNAGKKQRLRGARSGLWREFARVIEAVEPKLVFIENVGAVLQGGVLAVVLDDLARLRFNAEWCCLSSRDVGAPVKKRERWFLLGCSQDSGEAMSLLDRSRRGRSTNPAGVLPANGQARTQTQAREVSVARTHGVQEKVSVHQGSGPAFPPTRDAAEAGLCESRHGPASTRSDSERSTETKYPLAGVVDGMASRQLRSSPDESDDLLGNGVVPILAAVAFELLSRRMCDGYGNEH